MSRYTKDSDVLDELAAFKDAFDRFKEATIDLLVSVVPAFLKSLPILLILAWLVFRFT